MMLVDRPQTGHRWDAATGAYLAKSLSPLEITYSPFELNREIHYPDAESLENLPMGLGGPYQFVDLDGEGISGVLIEQGAGWFFMPNLGRFDFETRPNGNGPPYAATSATLRESVRFGPSELVATKPSLANLQSSGQQILDLAGDGQKDLVLLGAAPGFYERTDDAWSSFRTAAKSPIIQLTMKNKCSPVSAIDGSSPSARYIS